MVLFSLQITLTRTTSENSGNGLPTIIWYGTIPSLSMDLPENNRSSPKSKPKSTSRGTIARHGPCLRLWHTFPPSRFAQPKWTNSLLYSTATVHRRQRWQANSHWHQQVDWSIFHLHMTALRMTLVLRSAMHSLAMI